jgi:hypothetical protein
MAARPACADLLMADAECNRRIRLHRGRPRDTASRLGISASSIDDALYSTFGRRIVFPFVHRDQPVPRVILEALPSQFIKSAQRRRIAGAATTEKAKQRREWYHATGQHRFITSGTPLLEITHVDQFRPPRWARPQRPGSALGRRWTTSSVQHSTWRCRQRELEAFGRCGGVQDTVQPVVADSGGAGVRVYRAGCAV